VAAHGTLYAASATGTIVAFKAGDALEILALTTSFTFGQRATFMRLDGPRTRGKVRGYVDRHAWRQEPRNRALPV